jgi:hypothetical protein
MQVEQKRVERRQESSGTPCKNTGICQLLIYEQRAIFLHDILFMCVSVSIFLYAVIVCCYHAFAGSWFDFRLRVFEASHQVGVTER